MTTITQVVAVPIDQAEAAIEALSGWGAVRAIHRVGEDGARAGLAVQLLATPVSMAMGMVGQGLGERLRPFGGTIGGTEAWLVAAQGLEGKGQ